MLDRWAQAPPLVKSWVLLTAAGFVAGLIVDPREGVRWGEALFDALVVVALINAILRHSKTGWVISLVFAGLGVLLGGLSFWNRTRSGEDDEVVWAVWGLVYIVAGLALLLSKQMKDWVSQPTERRWDP